MKYILILSLLFSTFCQAQDGNLFSYAAKFARVKTNIELASGYGLTLDTTGPSQQKKQIIVLPSKDTTVIDLTVTSVATASSVTDYKLSTRVTRVTPPPVVTDPPVVTPPTTGIPLPNRAPDFDGSKLSGWPVKAGDIKETTYNGRQALVFHVTPTQKEVANGRRSEVNQYSKPFKPQFGVWTKESLFIPATSVPTNPLLSDVISQFHDPNETAATALRKDPFDLSVSGTNLVFTIRHDKELNGAKVLSIPVAYGQWMDIVTHIVFSSTGKGVLQVWLGGKQMIDYKGPLGFSGGTQAPFWKIGDYFYAWNSKDKSQLSFVKGVLFRERASSGAQIWYE